LSLLLGVIEIRPQFYHFGIFSISLEISDSNHFIEVAVQSGNIGFNDHPFDRLSLMRSVFIGEKQI
jgi:hypothetical protein